MARRNSKRSTQHNIIDYLQTENRSLEKRGLCDADFLAFCALSHLEFERVPELQEHLPLTLGVLSSLPQAHTLSDGTYVGPLSSRVLELCGTSTRMRGVQVRRCEAYFNMDEMTQFAAISLLVRTPEPLLVIAFRGTGSELTGWHEDFNMAVNRAVPAQLRAVRFLEDEARSFPGLRIMLTGHSKGGALAEYAALFCKPDVQERIDYSVVFDAPGLFGLGGMACPEFESTDVGLLDRYNNAPFPLVRYVFPMFVGLMLEPRPLECMRYCEGIDGKFPHNMDSVAIEKGEFVLRVPSTEELLKATAINRWVEQMTLAERQLIIDSVFAEFYSSGVQLDFTKMADMRTWAWLFSLHYARAGQEKRKQLARIMGLAAKEFVRR